jgi:tRNA(Arg) A34 adenosine deaminase TadA
MPKLPSQEEKDKFMRRAVEVSKEGSYSGLGTPYGAVIVRDGKVIGKLQGKNIEIITDFP